MQSDRCNTCGATFSDAGGVMRQTHANRAFMASRDADGIITAECCDDCAQELWDSLEEDAAGRDL